MSKTQVNFQHYSLVKTTIKDKVKEEAPFVEVGDLLEFISNKDKKDRKFNLKNNKICFLEVLNIKENERYLVYYGIFAVAKRDYRPPIIDTEELTERDNPRSMKEGDKDRVYFALKIELNERPLVSLILQRTSSRFNSNSFKNYLTSFFREMYPDETSSAIRVDVQMCNSFFTEMQRMKRASAIEVSFDKKILTDKFSSFSKDIIHVENNVKVSVKAKRKKNIEEMAMDAANHMHGDNEDSITNVFVKGYDEDDHEMVVDMQKLFRISSDKVEKYDGPDGTGELNSRDMFSLLLAYAAM